MARAAGHTPPGWSAHAASAALKRLMPAPSSASGYVLQLQRQYGNHYVQRVLTLAGQQEDQGEVSPEIEGAIASARGRGQALEPRTRRQMESAFGTDFSGVHVHTGAEAHSLNQAVNAVAFTAGQDIFFRNGAYEPGSSTGKELLAHELTHVVQQNGALVQSKSTISQPGDEFEVEAEQVAKAVVSGLTGGSPDLSMHVQRRCPSCAEAEEDQGGGAD